MANQYEDEDDLDVETTGSQDGPGDLRKAYKREQKARATLEAELAQLKAESRQRSVKDVLATKGVPDKVAKFIPADVTTPDQVDAWLTENADVFGFAPADAEPAPTDDAKAANKAAYQRINAATQNASAPTRDAELAAQLNNAKTLEELNAITGHASQRRR